jgi:hypothetical protein
VLAIGAGSTDVALRGSSLAIDDVRVVGITVAQLAIPSRKAAAGRVAARADRRIKVSFSKRGIGARSSRPKARPPSGSRGAGTSFDPVSSVALTGSLSVASIPARQSASGWSWSDVWDLVRGSGATGLVP